MRRSSSLLGRAVAGALSLSMALAFAAPAAATESRVASGAAVKATLAASAARITATSAAPRAFTQDTGTTTAPESRSFFRTRTGLIATVLMIAGTGYTLYSVNNDRKPVKSPIR